MIFPFFDSIAKAVRVVGCWCLDGIHGNSQGAEWCELYLFPFVDVIGKVDTFRRNSKEVKMEMFVTSGSPGPAWKTSDEMTRVTHREEEAPWVVCESQRRVTVWEEWCKEREGQGSFVTAWCQGHD